MKTTHFLSAALLAAACFMNPLNNNLNAQTAMTSKTMAPKQYACPHHADKISDKPGKCACGMDLVEVKAPSKMAGEAKPMMKSDSKMDKCKSKKMKRKMEKKPSQPMKSKDDMMAKPSTDMKKESDMKQKM